MRPVAYAVLCTMMLAPAALAEYNETKPDCPPDMFCTSSVEDPYADLVQQPPSDDPASQNGLAEPAKQDAPAVSLVMAVAALGLLALARRD